jgi:hypothetical protein
LIVNRDPQLVSDRDPMEDAVRRTARRGDRHPAAFSSAPRDVLEWARRKVRR